MGRPMTPIDVDAVGKEAWDATQLEVEGNPPWDELAGDAKQRYSDVIYNVCTFGGASNPFEQKAQEIWAEKQNEDPPEAEEPAPEKEPDPSVLPVGTDLTPAALAAAIRKLEGNGETAAAAKPAVKEAPKPAPKPEPAKTEAPPPKKA